MSSDNNTFNAKTIFQINEINQKHRGKKIGFTCSSFDLLHSGNLLLLQDCKSVCDILVVGLQNDIKYYNSDTTSKDRYKPIQNINEREIQIRSCKYVDEVILYSTEDDIINILKILNPDVRILGSDWENKKYTGFNLPIDVYFHNKFHEWTTVNLRKRIYITEKEILNNKY
jgi:glycerol-3-phosphate cytidylyltransferase